jgi:GPH family glycoside/pentoside/hexuronide:cation symporter
MKLKAYLGYAAAGIGDSGSYTFLNTFLLFFLTTVAGIGPAVAGAIAAIGALSDSLWGPIVGYLSDNVKNKKGKVNLGRRRQFLLLGAFPLAIATVLLFTYVGGPQPARVLYYGALTFIAWIAFATFFVPYAALGAEVALDYNDRSTIRTLTYILNQIGSLFGMVFPTIILDLVAKEVLEERPAWTILAATVAAASLISIVITVVATRGREILVPAANNGDTPLRGMSPESHVIPAKAGISDLIRTYKEILKLKPLRILLYAAILSLIAYTMTAASRMYFWTYNADLSGSIITILMTVFAFGGIPFTPFILRFSKKTDKKTAMIACLLIASVGVIVMSFIHPTSVTTLLIIAFLYCFSGAGYWQLMPAAIYDICELDELTYGKRREGAIVSLLSLAESLSSAITMQVLGLILQFSGFDGEAKVQTDAALSSVNFAFLILPPIMLIATALLMWRYPIGRKEFADIKGELDRRE